MTVTRGPRRPCIGHLIDFQDGSHLVFPIRAILAAFDVQVTFIHPMKFRVSWLFGSRKKKFKINSQHGGYGDHFKFLSERFLAILSYKSPENFLSSFESTGLSVQEEKFKLDIQDGDCGGHLGIFDRNNLATFDLQVAPILPTKFRDNWPFRPGEEEQNRFSRWRPWQPSTSCPILPTKFPVNWSFVSGEEAQNKFSRWPP